MPRMIDTVPIPKSTFILSVPCSCGSSRFKSEGGSEIKCLACGKYFMREGHYEQDAKRLQYADWSYDPVPAAATNT